MRMLVIVTLILLAAVFSGCVPQGDRHRQEDMPAEAKMSQAAADRFDMLLWQAEDYHTPDEYEEAMAELRKKVQMAENDFPSTDPSRWEYVYTVAVMVSGSAEEVSARIEKHASEYPSSDWTARALLAYADEKFDGSRYSEARGVYSRLLRDFSDYRSRYVTYRIAVCDYLNGEVESAGETAMEILQKSPNSVEAVNCHMLLGIISHADKDEQGALNHLSSYFERVRPTVEKESKLMADLNKAVNALCDETSGDMQLNFMALRARLYGDKSDEALAFAAEFIKHKPSSELAISGLQYGRMMVSFRIPDDEIVAHARTWKTVAPADMKGLFLALELWIHFDNEEYERVLYHYNRAPAAEKSEPLCHTWAAHSYIYFDMYDEAYEVALEALEQMPYDGDLTGAKHICSLVSKKAPALRGTDLLTGESFDISDMKGHIVILDFRHYLEGISCDEIKFLRDIKQKWHDTGVRIVSVTVSLEEPGIQEGIVAGFKANGMNWTSLYGGVWNTSAVRRRYGVTSVPYLLLVGRDGVVRCYKKYGEYIYEPLRKEIARPVTTDGE